MFYNFINWQEKSLALVKATMGDLSQFTLKLALEKALAETAFHAEASEILIFSIETTEEISVLSAKKTELEGKLVGNKLFYNLFFAESIKIRILTPEEKSEANIVCHASIILIIPLKVGIFNGILVLGFNAVPQNKVGLLGFGEIARILFLKIFQLESPGLGFNKCRDGVKSKKIQTDLFNKETAFLNKPVVNFKTFLAADYFVRQEHTAKKRYPSGFESIKPGNVSLKSNEIGKEILISKKENPPQRMFGSTVFHKNTMLDGILKNLPLIVFRIGADGVLLETGGEGLRKIGIHVDEYLGKSAIDFIPELENALSVFSKGEGNRFFMAKTVIENLVIFDFQLFHDETHPGDIIGFAIDVTDQKQFESELRKKLEIAENASLAKSNFLANQSHEIRTPINSILGFAQLIKKNKWTEESEEYLDYIISSGQILSNLIGNVLDLTKIEEGKMELVIEPFNLKEVVTEGLIPYQIQAQEKGLEFHIEFDSHFPKYFVGDGNKILQIIINLIGNSLKFTKKGIIEVSFSSPSKAEEEGKKINIKIAVSDTGIGIPKDRQKEIFDSFIQADSNIQREFGGSGLGLSIVKEMVNLMDGDLGVESPSQIRRDFGEQGSTFWVEIPLTIAYPPQEKFEDNTGDPALSYHGNVNILLVDDNYLNQCLGSILLKNLGCNVTVANNGEEAIDWLSKDDFHLIFMDVQMPVLNGYETTKKIRQQLVMDIPIIGLSANVQKEDIDLCYDAGMDDYLGRPYTFKNFHEKVFKWTPGIGVKKIQQFPVELNANPRLIQLEMLDQIFYGNQKQIAEIVRVFIDYQKNMMVELEGAIINKRYTEIASLAHHIRSSIQTVGLNSLHEPLINIEVNAGKDKNDVFLAESFFTIKQIWEDALLELNELNLISKEND